MPKRGIPKASAMAPLAPKPTMPANPRNTTPFQSARANPNIRPLSAPIPTPTWEKPNKNANTKKMKKPTPKPREPATARAMALFELLRASPRAAPPHAPAKNHERCGGHVAHQGGSSAPRPGGNIGAVKAINTLLKNPATANPIPNPTAPKMTNRSTLVALTFS